MCPRSQANSSLASFPVPNTQNCSSAAAAAAAAAADHHGGGLWMSFGWRLSSFYLRFRWFRVCSSAFLLLLFLVQLHPNLSSHHQSTIHLSLHSPRNKSAVDTSFVQQISTQCALAGFALSFTPNQLPFLALCCPPHAPRRTERSALLSLSGTFLGRTIADHPSPVRALRCVVLKPFGIPLLEKSQLHLQTVSARSFAIPTFITLRFESRCASSHLPPSWASC